MTKNPIHCVTQTYIKQWEWFVSDYMMILDLKTRSNQSEMSRMSGLNRITVRKYLKILHRANKESIADICANCACGECAKERVCES
jgi:hypothetical protein